MRVLTFIACATLLPSLAHADSFCITNTDTETGYYSVRDKDGSASSNFTLASGASHKVNFNEPERYFVCASKRPMTSDCPQRFELTDLRRC